MCWSNRTEGRAAHRCVESSGGYSLQLPKRVGRFDEAIAEVLGDVLADALGGVEPLATTATGLVRADARFQRFQQPHPLLTQAEERDVHVAKPARTNAGAAGERPLV